MNNSTVNATDQKNAVFYYKVLTLIIMLALGARIYVSFFTGLAWFNTDTYEYFKMADAILIGQPYSFFPNGYPLLISIAKLLFTPEMVPTALIIINVVLSTLVVAMAADMAQRMTGNMLFACIAAISIAFYPNQLNYVRQLLTEVPTTFLVTLSVFLLLKRNYFFSGFVLYLAVLFRSSMLPILPMLVACSLLHPDKKNTIPQGIKYLAGVGAGLALYTMLLEFDIVKPAENLSMNLLLSISSYSQNINFGAAENFSSEEKLHPIRTYVMFALDHPAEYVKQRILSLQELWGWPAAGDPPRSFISKALIGLRLPLIILAVFGFYKGIKTFDAWILFIPIIALTLVHIAMFSSPRFTYPIEPFAIILATIAIKSIMNTNKALSSQPAYCSSNN